MKTLSKSRRISCRDYEGNPISVWREILSGYLRKPCQTLKRKKIYRESKAVMQESRKISYLG